MKGKQAMKIWIIWNSSEYAEDGLAGATLDESVAVAMAKGNLQRISCWDTKLGFVQFTKIGDYYFSSLNGWQRTSDPGESRKEQTMTEAKICIVKRRDDYVVFLESKPEIWDCGESIDSAIQEFIITWRTFDYVTK